MALSSPFAKTKCIVTGGAGFIGSHLVDRLLDEGHDVTAIDNLAVGRQANLAHLRDNPRFRLEIRDIAEPGALDGLFDTVDRVFHLAALADIVPSIEHPDQYHRANVDGTFAVLEAARQAGVRRFVYAASSSCYGIPDVYPTPETAPIRPMYPYALTKWIGESYALHWCRTYGLPVVSLRLFNVFGPRARTAGTYGAVFGVFLRQKLAGQPFTIVGDGTQTRDFTYVGDVVEAFIAAANSTLVGEVLNVGSGGSYSVRRLAELLGGPTMSIPKRPGEPDTTFADIARIQGRLGWRPRIPFEEGVARVLANIEMWRDAPLWTPERIEEATRGWFRHLGRDSAGAPS
ncbi:MAG: SDR family oxidoreductase [Rhodospirillales bacterium]|nr:SDR family oxidoreductase [Rhodospirillales bacterium]